MANDNSSNVTNPHPCVTECLGRLTWYDQAICFPHTKPETPLLATDYCNYLTLVHNYLRSTQQKFDQVTRKLVYENFICTCYDSDSALKGLSAYLDQKTELPFKQLTLDLKHLPHSTLAIFITYLCDFLSIKSEHHITSLQFINADCFDENNIKLLCDYLYLHPVSFDITLPLAFQHTIAQQRLDEVLATHIKNRHMKSAQLLETKPTLCINHPVQKRNYHSKLNFTFDVEIQKQAEIALSFATERTDEKSILAVGSCDNYTMDEFATAWCEGKLSRYANSHFLDCSKENAYELWCNWIGAISAHDARESPIRISKKACEELLRYHTHYQFGLDLPTLKTSLTGFTLEQNETIQYIDFNARIKHLFKPQPMSIKTCDPLTDSVLLHTQVNIILTSNCISTNTKQALLSTWQQLNKTPYNKKSNQLFRQYLPKIILLEDSAIVLLLALIRDEHTLFNSERFEFLMQSALHQKHKDYEKFISDPNLRLIIESVFTDKSEPRLIRSVVASKSDQIYQFIWEYQEKKSPLKSHAIQALLEPNMLKKVERFITSNKATEVNLDGLLQLFLSDSEQGLDAFIEIQQKYPTIFSTINQYTLKNNHQYKAFIQPNFTLTLATIAGFLQRKHTRSWWTQLFEKHCRVNSEVNVVDLVIAFTEFNNTIKSIIEKKTTLLPNEFDPRFPILNMPVALSRIVTLLKQSSEENKYPLLLIVSCLNLCSASMIKYISSPGIQKIAFVTEEMAISKPHELLFNPWSKGFNTRAKWQDICARNIGLNIYKMSANFNPDNFPKRRSLLLIEDQQELQTRYTIKLTNECGINSKDMLSYTHVYATPSSGEKTIGDYESILIIQKLMGNRTNFFIRQDQLAELSTIPIDKSLIGINLYFNTPSKNAQSNSLIYNKSKQTLFYITTAYKAIELSVDAKFEKNIQAIINQSLDKARSEFFIKKIANIITNKINKMYLYDFVDSLKIAQQKLNKSNHTMGYFYIQNTKEIYCIEKNKLPHKQLISPDKINQLNHDIEQFAQANSTNEMFFLTLEEIKENLADVYFQIYDYFYELPTTIRHFFRFGAMQNPKGGMPLSIYQYTHKKIQQQKMPTTIKCQLYAFLASALAEANDHLIKPEDAIPYINEIIEFKIPLYSKIPFASLLPHAEQLINYSRTVVLDLMSLTHKLPPLPLFMNLMRLTTTNFSDIFIRDQLVKSLSNFQNIDSVYRGMQDYCVHNHHSDLLIDHVITLEALNECITQSKNTETIYIRNKILDHVFELISTFKIKIQGEIEQRNYLVLQPIRLSFNVKKARNDKIIKKINAYFINKNEHLLLKILGYLVHINLKKHSHSTQLISDDFFNIIDKFNPKKHAIISDYLQTFRLINGRLLGSYFSIEILSLHDHTISEDTNQEINHFFTTKKIRNTLYDLLKQFPTSVHHLEFVKLLTHICKKLSTEDQSNFLYKIKGAVGLYTPIESLDPARNPFVKLLKLVHSTDTLPLLLQFIEAERTILQKIHPTQFSTNKKQYFFNYLSERAHLYIKSIACELSKYQNPTIPSMELTQRVFATLLKTPIHELRHVDYAENILSMCRKLNRIALENPGVKKSLLELFDHYLKNYLPISIADHEPLINGLLQFINQLQISFYTVQNKNIVISLCTYFKKNSETELTPEGLIKLLKLQTDNKEINNPSLLKIATSLISNNKGYTYSSLKQLCDLTARVTEHPYPLRSLLTTFYKNAPFPSIKQVIQWHNKAQVSPLLYQEIMLGFYHNHNIKPCPRDPQNGFNSNDAKQQLTLFKFNLKYPITPICIDSYATKIKDMQPLSTDALLLIFKVFNCANTKAPLMDYEQLAAVVAELLFRSNTIEINTTQYLAILAMLKSSKHVTNQIETGEGKSRIMMIMCACHYAQGRTVDFITSDMQLATRDFIAYQPFFNLIEAPTKLIFSDSAEYQKQGINFSDATNLIHCRNQARSQGRDHDFIDEPNKRALVGDEADQIFFDAANNRFNYSEAGDPTIRKMPWIYSLLVTYFFEKNISFNNQTLSAVSLFKQDIDGCRNTFLNYAYTQCTEEQKIRLAAIPNKKIEEWQTMAYEALLLVFKQHYEIQTNQLISTDKGVILSSVVRLLISNELSINSRLSFGMHQCLEALLNYLRHHPDYITDLKLKQKLLECDYPFFIADEKQIIISSSIKNLLDDYADGFMTTATGTMGSKMEQVEIESLYNMSLISTPRKNPLRRRDKAPRILANRAQQQQEIQQEIAIALANNRPVLLIAKNPRESEDLFNLLKNNLGLSPQQIQHIHPSTSEEARNEGIKKSSLAGMITVTTGILSRGTDILLETKSKKSGLLVLTTSLTPTRDKGQQAGRSGRYGDLGDFLPILNQQDLVKQFGIDTNSVSFYTNQEQCIADALAKMEKKTQRERLIKLIHGDFTHKLSQNFYNTFKNNNIQPTPYRSFLSEFYTQSDQAWNIRWPVIQTLLQADSIDIKKINLLLNDYRATLQTHWSHLRLNTLSSVKKEIGLQNSTCLNKSLIDTLPLLQVSAEIEKIMKCSHCEKTTNIYDYYDNGHDGRYVKYTHWSIPIIASLKGWANLLPGVHFSEARKPFATVRAWWAGRGLLFADFMVSKHKALIISLNLASLLILTAGIVLIIFQLIPIVGITVLTVGAILTLTAFSGGMLHLVDNMLSNTIKQSSHKVQTSHSTWQVVPHQLPTAATKPATTPNMQKQPAAVNSRPLPVPIEREYHSHPPPEPVELVL